MASTVTTDGSTQKPITDKVIGFLTEPLGMGLVAGAAIATFLLWRVI